MMQRTDTGSKREYAYERVHTDFLQARLDDAVAGGWEVHTLDFPAGGQMANVLFTRLVVEERQYLADAVRAGVM